MKLIRFELYKKRHFIQKIDKMESMNLAKLTRFRTMFRKHLKVWELIVLQRLGVDVL